MTNLAPRSRSTELPKLAAANFMGASLNPQTSDPEFATIPDMSLICGSTRGGAHALRARKKIVCTPVDISVKTK
jgi:hypothetical protein